MERIIKFRCWDKENKKWLDQVSVYEELAEQGMWDPGRSEYYHLMQYSGLKDKQGVEVYEGDLVKYMDRILQVRFGSYIECWDGLCPKNGHNAHGWFMCSEDEKTVKSLLTGWMLPQMKDIEIVGNIYENEEFLKQTERHSPD
jgi:uncharacterized phage protein (TIGR01671 family)